MLIKTIIDAYNVIFECGLEEREASPGQLERARHRFLNYLVQKFTPLQCQQTLVVFDSKKRPHKDALDRIVFHGIQVVFATEYPDADTCIEEFLRLHSAPKQLLIVSSDHRLQNAAKRRKSKSQDSEPWWSWVESLPDSEKPGTPNALAPITTDAGDESEKGVPHHGTENWYEELGGHALDEEVQTILNDSNPAAPSQPIEPAGNSDSTKPSKNDKSIEDLPEVDSDYNPFPPGYTDDLFEESD